jgi:hypothetical protein
MIVGFELLWIFARFFKKSENHIFLFFPRPFWENRFWTFINVLFPISQKGLD